MTGFFARWPRGESGNDLFDYPPSYIRQPEPPAIVLEGELLVIESEKVEDGGV